ncbi:MAG TPA: VWA domain-containing protein [Gammaproteobacteria bacterium]
MMQLEWPWALLLLPLPLIIRLLLPAAASVKDAALRVPTLEYFNLQSSVTQQTINTRWLLLLAILAWCCLVIATARPQWLGDRVDLPISGRDLMLAVDLSESMLEQDFESNGQLLNRLQAVKKVAGDFIQQREGDRIGLILFGENAYLQTPLTFDLKTVNILLQEAAIGLAGKSTAIGDAIGLAIKRLRDKDKNSRVLILLTDGRNTSGEVKPIKAAELAAEQELKIYTIGIGAKFVRRRLNNEIDEKTLSAIADKTGGKYFRAHDTAELKKIYQLLNELEPVEVETKSFRPVTSLFYWPLTAAILIAALLSLLRISGIAK